MIGVVTDRDICLAVGTKNRVAGDMTIGEIATNKSSRANPMTKFVRRCRPWRITKCDACPLSTIKVCHKGFSR